DKGLAAEQEDFPVHSPPDFFVKPVRRDDLLVWLGQMLGLRWRQPELNPAAPAALIETAQIETAQAVAPDELLPLLDIVRLGYYKGIVLWLDQWLTQRPEQAEFAQNLRTLAREFRFEAIEQRLLPLCPSALPVGSQP
ncbi:MAG: hypothetical protein WEK74_01105, partial [Hydrogenophaga sp.]